MNSESIPNFKYPQKELTPSQELHNALLDFEIAEAEREFQKREEFAKLTGTINVIGRRKIIGLRYVI